MYSLLSKSAQGQISEADFTKRYENIYQGIDALGLSATTPAADKSGSSSKKAQIFDFRATWKTAMTNPFTEKYKATLVKDSDGWKVDWHDNLIFPQLKSGWKVQAQSTEPTRGEILTSDGKYLAQNQAAEQVGLVPGKMVSSSPSKLAKVLNVSVSTVNSDLHQAWVKPDLFVPVRTLPQQTEQTLEKRLLAIPGVLITPAAQPVRVYPQNSVASQVVGYVGPITATELTKQKQRQGYSATDTVGQEGLEAEFEPELRGQLGGKIWVTDPSGKTQTTIASRTPVKGENITVTLNSKVETALTKSLGNYVGSAVVLDPTTGAVLGMASTPGFNPNEFVNGLTSKQWNQIQKAKNSPLVNRALAAVPPGSSIKPLVAAVALQDGAIKPSTTFPGTNHLKWQKDSSWGSFYVTRVPHPNGTVNLQNALVWSDNIYFAQVGLALGDSKFVDGLKQFGFGDKLKFALPVEPSQISDSGGIDTDIQLANSAYGQGQVLVSPLQMASMYTAFFNNGDVLAPYLVQAASAPAPSANAPSGIEGKRTVLASHVVGSQTISTLTSDMQQVVANSTGTGHGISGLPGWSVLGKTGTAQTQSNSTGPEWGWFVALAKPVPSSSQSQSYLIVMALANTQDAGGSHLTVQQVRQFLEDLRS